MLFFIFKQLKKSFEIMTADADNKAISEANKASFRPPHPSHASTAQQDWDDHVAPVRKERSVDLKK